MRTSRLNSGLMTVFTAVAFASCGPNAEISSTLLEDTAIYNSRIQIAIDEVASDSDENAFKLWAYSKEGLKSGTVRFCFGDVAGCQSGTNISIAAVDGRKGTVDAFVSEKFVKLSDNLNIVVLAQNNAGQSVVQKAQIKPAGVPSTPDVTPDNVSPDNVPPQNQASECHNAPDELTCQVELAVWRKTNEKRASVGKPELKFAKYIGCASRLWSVEQARRGSISHEWFSNGTLRQKYQSECQGKGSLMAENVAMAGGAGSDAESIATRFVEMWWNSPGHKANMLGNHAEMGVGFAKSASGSWYGTQNFGRE